MATSVALKYPSSTDRLECFVENKNKIRTIWGWKLSKNKDIEPYQNSTGSYTLRCLINGGTFINFSIFFDPPEFIRTPRLLISKEYWGTKFFSVGKWVFSFIEYFSFNLELRNFFVICFFVIFENLFDWLFT